MKFAFIDPESCVLESFTGENATVGKSNNECGSGFDNFSRRNIRVFHKECSVIKPMHVREAIQNIPLTVPATGSSALQNATYKAVINVSKTGNQVFNIIGVVLIIAAIMSIIGLVYSYIKPRGA